MRQSLQVRIESGVYSPGCRLPSETALAQTAGCSRQTVRRAIDRLESDGLVTRIQGSGTYVRSQSAPARVKTVGVVSTYVDDYIFSSIIRGMETVLTESGCGMQLAFTHNQVELEAQALKSMLGKGVDGLIVEPAKSGFINFNRELYLQVRQAGIPLLFFNAYCPGLPGFPHVAMDDRAAGRLVTEHLLGRGHRKIAALFQADDLQGQLRYAGYADALRRKNLTPEPEHILWFATQDIPHLTEDMDRVLRAAAGCSALVCYNDQIAYALCGEFARRGVQIPGKLSVVGIDNSETASLCSPPLTTAAHPMDRLGAAAARQMLKMIADPGFAAGMEFQPELIVRQSTADVRPQKTRQQE